MLHQSLRTLMESNKVNQRSDTETKHVMERVPRMSPPTLKADTPSTASPTFFDELRNNIEEIKSQRYVPPRREPEPERTKGAEESEESDVEPATAGLEPPKSVVHRDMLVSKLERQGIAIETLEAEVRQLRLQNQQLREANHGLRETAARNRALEAPKGTRFGDTRPRDVELRPSQNNGPVEAKPPYRHPATSKNYDILRSKPLEKQTHGGSQKKPTDQNSFSDRNSTDPLSGLRARAEEAETQLLRHELLVDQLRAGLTTVHSRYKEAQRRLAASLEVAAFQERVILSLKAKDKQREKKMREREKLARNRHLWVEHNLEFAESTAELIQGYRETFPGPSDSSGCENEGPSSHHEGASSDSESELGGENRKTDDIFDADVDAFASTTQLISGLRAPDPYDHLRRHKNSTLRAAALAVLFTVRLARAHQAKVSSPDTPHH